jgi:hypothetical protein
MFTFFLTFYYKIKLRCKNPDAIIYNLLNYYYANTLGITPRSRNGILPAFPVAPPHALFLSQTVTRILAFKIITSLCFFVVLLPKCISLVDTA